MIEGNRNRKSVNHPEMANGMSSISSSFVISFFWYFWERVFLWNVVYFSRDILTLHPNHCPNFDLSHSLVNSWIKGGKSQRCQFSHCGINKGSSYLNLLLLSQDPCVKRNRAGIWHCDFYCTNHRHDRFGQDYDHRWSPLLLQITRGLQVKLVLFEQGSINLAERGHMNWGWALTVCPITSCLSLLTTIQ